MVAGYAVGKSSFGALRGVTQYVTSADVAAQVLSLIEESRAAFSGGGVLSVNEGVRSKADQAQKLAEYLAYRRGGPWAPLAASPLYTSNHDESRGNALDFGVTMPDGSNRALYMSEHTWLVGRGKLRGIEWTGRTFGTPESWHFNGGYPAALPPLSSAGVTPAGDAPVPVDETDELTMAQYDELKKMISDLTKVVVKDRDVTARMDQNAAAAADSKETLDAILALLTNVDKATTRLNLKGMDALGRIDKNADALVKSRTKR